MLHPCQQNSFCMPIIPLSLVRTGFLELINNMLTTGTVPVLFAEEEREAIVSELRDEAVAHGCLTTKDSVWQYFMDKCACNLHIILCMSPVSRSGEPQITVSHPLTSHARTHAHRHTYRNTDTHKWIGAFSMSMIIRGGFLYTHCIFLIRADYRHSFVYRLLVLSWIIVCPHGVPHCWQVGDELRNRCRNFPGIVNNTTIDWFFPWPEQALYAVAKKYIPKGYALVPRSERKSVITQLVAMHLSVYQYTAEFAQQLRRVNFVTPKHYLDCINTYKR